jgi:hypothetical protein
LVYESETLRNKVLFAITRFDLALSY